MAKSSKYWEGRFNQIEQSAHDKSVEYYNQVEQKYRQAEKEINAKINTWYQRFAVNNEVDMTEAKRLLNSDELKELKWDVKQYIKAGEENAIDQRWMKELENASAKFHINRLEALKLDCRQSVEVAMGGMSDDIDDMLKSVYTDTFYHSCFEVQKGYGVSFDVSKINDKQLQTLINKPWSADGSNFSSKVWTNKTKLLNNLDSELSRMVMTGKSPKQTINNISKSMQTSKSNATRLIMTEQAYFTSVAQKDSFKELDVEEYEIVATLDSTTCNDCGGLDGQHFPINDMLPGVNAAPFHPYCRCTQVPYFDDEFTDGERWHETKVDDKGKEVKYEVPENMTYDEWKNGFVDGNKGDLKPVEPVVDIEEVKNKISINNKQIESLASDYSTKQKELENQLLFGNASADELTAMQKEAEAIKLQMDDMLAKNDELKKLLPDVTEVRKAQVINGKNIMGEVDYSSGEFEHDIETAMHTQGYDGTPSVMKYEDFKEAMEKSNFYAERTYAATSQEVLDEYQNQLYNGKWYVDCSEGGSQYGQGMYCAASYDLKDNISMGGIGTEMSGYQVLNQGKGAAFSYTEAITLQPNAKILELPNGAKAEEYISDMYQMEWMKKNAPSELQSAIIEYEKASKATFNIKATDSKEVWDAIYDARDAARDAIPSHLFRDSMDSMQYKLEGSKYPKLKDAGTLAVEMGYDAINAVGHGESGSYTVILNRTKVIFCKGGSIYGN